MTIFVELIAPRASWTDFACYTKLTPNYPKQGACYPKLAANYSGKYVSNKFFKCVSCFGDVAWLDDSPAV